MSHTRLRCLFFVRFLSALLISALAAPSPGYALRPVNAGMEESTVGVELERKLRAAPIAGAEEDGELQARPMRVVFRVRPGAPVEADLPTGEKVAIYIKTRGANRGKVVIPQPRNYITYRERSLQRGAVWGYTRYKTVEKILPLKRRGDEGYERRVDQGVYFFPVDMVQALIDRNAPPEEWRAAAPYVFWQLSRNSNGSVDVEMRYREPAASSSSAGAEEKEEYLWKALRELLEEAAPRVVQHSNFSQKILEELREKGDDPDQARKILEEILPSGWFGKLLGMVRLRPGERDLRNVVETVNWFQQCLDPKSPRFNIESWTTGPFGNAWNELLERQQAGVAAGKDLLDLVDRWVRPVKPDFNLHRPLQPEEPLNEHHLGDLFDGVLDQVLIPHHFYYDKAILVRGGVWGKLERIEEDYRTPAGHPAPVYLLDPSNEVAPLVREALSAWVRAGRIIISTSREKRFRDALESIQAFWKKYEPNIDKMDFDVEEMMKHPPEARTDIIRSFILAQTYGPYGLQEAKRRYREHLLSEEGAHWDTEQLISDLIGHRVDRELDAEKVVQIVKEKIVREKQYLRSKLEEVKSRPIKEQVERADAILEVEAWLCCIRDTPVPAQALFQMLIDPEIGPSGERYKLTSHVGAADHLNVLLGSRLLKKGEELDASAWLKLFSIHVLPAQRFAQFNAVLKGLAKEVLEKQFTTPQERKATPTGLEEEAEELRKRMPEWLGSVLSAEELFESVHRVHDPAIMSDRVAALIEPELLPENQQDPSKPGFRLWEMDEQLRGIFAWEEGRSLRVDPWTEEREEYYRRRGYRIVRIVRDEKDPMRDPIPLELVLLVLSRAVSSGSEVFAVNVTHYLRLRGLTLDEIRATLTELCA